MSTMRPLFNDEKMKSEIKRVVDYAENYPLTISYLEGIGNGQNPPPGNNPNHRCMLCYLGKPGTGYSCVYTIDQAKRRADGEIVWLRHLSVAIDGKDCPNPFSVDFLMQEFGFRERLCGEDGRVKKDSKIKVWIEGEDDPESSKAINVVELFDEFTKT